MADVQQVIEAARKGAWSPVHVLVGPERFLIDRAVELLRRATLGDGPPGFNDDVFHGQGLDGGRVVAACRTLPMMAAARFVLVREADAMAADAREALLPYLQEPAESTCLVLVADKIQGTTRFAKQAKKLGVWADAAPLRPQAVPGFAKAEAKRRGHGFGPGAVEALADAVGTDLASLDDALERLSLYVGDGATIEVEAVEAVVSRVRVDSIWALVDSVAARDARRALAAAESLLGDREHPLRILALLARQLRTVARMRDALGRGLRGPEAAKAAGAPPFKARDLGRAAASFDEAALARAFATVADADLALKGSRKPGEVVLEDAILSLCR
jgi:DNA polymerase-3 subunit delta